MNGRKFFDLLAEFGKYGFEHQLSLREPATVASFTTHVSAAVNGAITDPALLHGLRVENMFEALVVSLGDFSLLKPEDGGRVFPAEPYRVPVFRIVLTDGTQWVVEVKNVFAPDPLVQHRKLMSRDYLERLERYAQATRAELKLAVYWARWSIWTLVTPHRFADLEGDVSLDMRAALVGSELGRLGDRSIGTRPPLCLRLMMDETRTSPIGEDGVVQCVIERASLYCGNVEIIDPVEQRIAWLFVQHGEWPESPALPLIEEDQLLGIELRWEPDDRVNEDFEMIGSLSRMFSRYFAEATLDGSKVVQLRAPLRPGWFQPLVTSGYCGQALPLWRFQQHPTYGGNTERPS